MDVSETDYAHFKYCSLYKNLEPRMAAFEGVGENEKKAIAKLRKHIEDQEAKISSNEYLKNEESYNRIEADLEAAFKQGDIQRITTIAETADLRRMPLSAGKSRESVIPGLQSMGTAQWPVLLHMLWENNAS